MTGALPTVLVVEDDPVAMELYRTILSGHGYGDPICCDDSREVMGLLGRHSISIILLDLNMPHVSGQELLREITSEQPEIPVIILTGEDKVDTAVNCMKIGAFDFMAKPIDENRLLNAIQHALKIRELQDEVHILSSSAESLDVRHPEAFSDIITNNPEMRKIFRYVEAIAPSPRAVLITGESGTGKELVARAVHNLSCRSGKFVAVNVSGLDETVFSDTLFGHTKGAFTGAERSRRGLIDEGRDGTLFLDEIGDLHAGAQVKLLRLLQEREYYPLGADTSATSRARIIAASNADLQERQRSGHFRKDLYYRLRAHHVEIPPLRSRREDIPLLIDYFLAEASEALKRSERAAVPDSVYSLLKEYSFPGNVRELQSLIYDAVSRHRTRVLPASLFKEYVRSAADADQHERGTPRISINGGMPTLQEVEEYVISEALRQTGGNQSQAARLLGVSQSTLSRRSRRTEE
jgi:DNA-binding NtrC family response regulator